MRSDRDGFFRELLKAAQETPGWRVEKLKSGHYRFWPPYPQGPIIAAGTVGSPKANIALRCRLRKAGLNVSGGERA